MKQFAELRVIYVKADGIMEKNMIKQLMEIVGSVLNHEPIYGDYARSCAKDVIYIYIPSTTGLGAGVCSVLRG
jgi:hypothetical protein